MSREMTAADHRHAAALIRHAVSASGHHWAALGRTRAETSTITQYALEHLFTADIASAIPHLRELTGHPLPWPVFAPRSRVAVAAVLAPAAEPNHTQIIAGFGTSLTPPEVAMLLALLNGRLARAHRTLLISRLEHLHKPTPPDSP